MRRRLRREHVANSSNQGFSGKRLLDEGETGLQHAVLNDGVFRVTGHVTRTYVGDRHPSLRATSRPLAPGRTTSVSIT